MIEVKSRVKDLLLKTKSLRTSIINLDEATIKSAPTDIMTIKYEVDSIVAIIEELLREFNTEKK